MGIHLFILACKVTNYKVKKDGLGGNNVGLKSQQVQLFATGQLH